MSRRRCFCGRTVREPTPAGYACPQCGQAHGVERPPDLRTAKDRRTYVARLLGQLAVSNAIKARRVIVMPSVAVGVDRAKPGADRTEVYEEPAARETGGSGGLAEAHL